MQLNRQSWTWSWSAAFHASARDALMPGPGGEPVELEVRVNGQPFRLLAERIGKSKRFPEYLVRVDGRGKAALLDPERGAVQTFSQVLDRTAQQLMGDVLTINGVGIGSAGRSAPASAADRPGDGQPIVAPMPRRRTSTRPASARSGSLSSGPDQGRGPSGVRRTGPRQTRSFRRKKPGP